MAHSLHHPNMSVGEVYATLDPKPRELLENPSRRLLLRGFAQLYNEYERKRKDRTLLLFNDVLLICKRLPTAKLRYRLRVYVTLRSSLQALLVDGAPGPNGFVQWRIIAPSRTFVLFSRNKKEAEDWIRRINNLSNGREMDYDAAAVTAAKVAKVRDKARRQQRGTGGAAVEASDSESDSESDSDESDESSSSSASTSEEPIPDAYDDSDDDDVVRVNPDAESFVPVLPGAFFTPKSAVAGVRVGKERKGLGSSSGSTGTRGKGRKGRSGSDASSKSGAGGTNGKGSKGTSSGKGGKRGGNSNANTGGAAASPGPAVADLLSFDDIVPAPAPGATSNHVAMADPFGGASGGGGGFSQGNPFGGQPASSGLGNPFGTGAAQAAADPFGGPGNPFASSQQAQQQAQSQEPVFFDPFAPTQPTRSPGNPFG